MSDFLVDINPNIELPKYELELHKLTEEPIMPLKNITNLQYKAFFVGIDELEFNIPLYRTESNGDKVKNEIYDLVDGEYLILLNQMKYFIITKIDEKSDDSGKVWKEVRCYSREYSLSHKKLVNYKANSRLLYDDTNSMLDGLEKGILNYIFNHVTKSWRIGYVDPDVILREGNGIYRSLDFPNTNLLQVFQELQKIYNCIFKFNTLERTMDVYSIDKKMGQHRGLYISDYNFLKSLSKEINYDEVKTRLFLYGKDNISIQSISPTGQPYIDNFNAYKNTKFMTQGLIDALNIYEEKVNNYNPDFEPLLQQLQEANTELENLYNADHPDDLSQKGLIALQRKFSEVQTMIDVKVEQLAIIMSSINNSDGTNLSDLYNDMKNVQTSIDALTVEKENINQLIINKETEISNQQKVIDGIKQQLHNLQYVLDVNNPDNFTEEQLRELDEFVRIETFNDSSYTENNITELYEEGVKLLNKISQPKIQFNTDVIDFLNVIECQHIWDKFVLGDIVTLEHNELGFNYDVRLVGYEHNIDSNSLNLKFSNTNTFDDANLYLSDLLEDFNTTSTAVDFNKYKWDKPDYLESKMSKYIDMKLEEARQNILNAVGQRYLFDDSGLWLYKENPDGTLNPEQIRAINNTIALTEDNWNTVGTAITPQGINAGYLRGKLGEFAKVSADQIEVGNEEQPLLEYIDTELTNTVNNLGDVINDALSDEKLTNIEANSIQLALDNVTAESTNLISTATSLSITTEKTNYQNALTALTDNLNTNWLGKEYPLAITSTQRTEINNQFKDLEDKKTILVNKITEIRANKAYQDAKNYTDNNALKQNFYYNRTKITEQEGIEVYDNLGRRVLQMGGIATGSSSVKNEYGFKAEHSDGSFSAVTKSGFVKMHRNGVAEYLNGIYIEEFSNAGAADNKPLPPMTITLPDFMAYRQGEIVFMLLPTYFSLTHAYGSQDIIHITVELEVVEERLNRSNPYIKVQAFTNHYLTNYTRSYEGMDFLVVGVGK